MRAGFSHYDLMVAMSYKCVAIWSQCEEGNKFNEFIFNDLGNKFSDI